MVVVLTPEEQNRKMVIPFYTAIAANSNITLVSSRIDMMYKVTKIEVHFRDDTQHNLRVRIIASGDTNAPTANPPNGTNITGKFSGTPYFVGQGQTIVAECYYIPSYSQVYLKAYIQNLNAFALTAMALVTVESITLDEAKTLVPPEKWTITPSEPIDYWKEYDGRGRALYYQVADLFAGTPAYVMKNDDKAWFENSWIANAIRMGAQRIGNYFDYIKTDDTDEAKAEAFHKWWDDAQGLIREYVAANAFIEIISVGQLDFQRDLIEIDKQIWQTFNNMGKVTAAQFEKAWLKPMERVANRTWLPERPTIDQMINMVVKEKLTVDEFKHWCKDLGLNDYWSGLIWAAHFRAPDFTEVRQAIWREGIKHDDIPQFLRRVDLDPFYNETVWYKLLYEIPPYTDLINMRVKEVIDQKTFAEALQNHGFYDPWASRLWDAHFTPPTFMDFLTAMRRKQTVTVPYAEKAPVTHTFGKDPSKDVDIIKELSILADYDPRYWDFFRQRIYEDPSARQARWGYEAGAINKERVYDLTKRAGLRDEDAEWFTEMLVTFQERPFITRYLNGLMAAYIGGVITSDELKKRVTAIPRREAVADWIIKIADLRKEVETAAPAKEKERLLTVGDLKRLFSMDLISETDFRTKMTLLGYETLDIQLIIDLTNKIKEETETGPRKHGLTTSEMFNAYKWYQITEEELRTDLMLRGLTLGEADLLINSKKKQWITKERWTETETA